VGLLGCSQGNPSAPAATVQLNGYVTYDDGRVVWRARVTDETNGTQVFSDRRGFYRLPVAADGESVAVHFQDGYTPGIVYVATPYADTVVSAARNQTINIVLRNSVPE
jgi:hypothetical protein